MKIEYNIVSIGTETQSNCEGYMAITELCKNKRYILPIGHSFKNYNNLKNSLIVKKKISIEKIAVSRFALITELFLSKNQLKIDEKILVIGCGCVGFACVISLLHNGMKNINFTDKIQRKIAGANFINLNDIHYSDFNVIIEATGNSKSLLDIINRCKEMTKIVLLGTYRDNPEIDALIIHRKNLLLFGAHELNGYTDFNRQKVFDRVVSYLKNSRRNFNDVVELLDKKDYPKSTREKIYKVYKNNL